MATLTTSPQVIGKNESGTIHTYLYGWYSDQSGNDCTVHARLTVINTGSTYTGTNKSYFVNLGGYSSGTQSWSYAPLDTNQEYTVSEATWAYSSGSQIYASAGFWSYAYGSADISLTEATYVPTFSVPPSGLNVTVAEVYPDGAKLNVSISSYGEPASATGRYIEAGIGTSNSWLQPLRRIGVNDSLSATLTVNNSPSNAGQLIIRPNTQYYYGGNAWNTQTQTSGMFGQLVTLPAAPMFSLTKRTDTTATVVYATANDGGYYTKTIGYSIDNGTTWKTAAIIATGAAATGSFTISNLTPGDNYNLMTRVVTTAGTTLGPTISLQAVVKGIYGSVNGKSKLVTNAYGSVNSESTHISKGYAPVNGKTKLIYQGFGHINYNQ